MLDRLSRQQQETGTHPHDWKVPNLSSRRTRSRSSSDYPLVPSRSIFRDVAIPYSLTSNSTAPPTLGQYPAPGHVAAHLLVLECFDKLKQEVESSSELSASFQARNQRLRGRRQTLKISTWTLYLELAIERFALWITRVESVIRHAAVFNRYGTGSHLHGAFTEHYLPPIDVLLIWYSYLQSPTAYERLIASNEFRLLSQICFPWHIIPTSINQHTLEYNFSHAAGTLWTNLVDIPPDILNCVDLEFERDEVAFMSASAEMLDIALRQSDFIESVAHYKWLRSPSLSSTIQRAMSRYVDQVVYTPHRNIERTQQIPTDPLEAQSLRELHFDLPSQLILNTHRAYHSAWQVFMQLNNLRDEETPPPPPSYDESHQNAALCQSGEKQSRDSAACYCWICERVKDELEMGGEATSMMLTPLRRVSSPEDEKATITSDSSSESEDSTVPLDLTKKQIKTIKADVAMYRHIENLRLKLSAR